MTNFEKMDSRSCYNRGCRCFEEKKYEDAILHFQKATNANYKRADYMLGICYEKGKGTNKDLEFAFDYYRKFANIIVEAATKTDFLRTYDLDSYLHPIIAEAFCKKAKCDNAEAQYMLALCYKYGQGVKQSDEKAVELFCKAAEQGFVEAQYMLGLCYKYGRGTKQSEETAKEWFSKAANNSDADAKYMLGCYYYNIQCYNEASKWLRQAFAQGCSDALSLYQECDKALNPSDD